MHPRTAALGEPKNPVLEFNAGTAAYRAGQFPQAAQAFQQSISHAPSSDPKRLADQEDAYYNLGNTLYRTGQKTEQTAPQETLQKWTEAVKAYETALQLRADDADSKFNRDLVKRKIDALKQQQNTDQHQNPQQNRTGSESESAEQGSEDQAAITAAQRRRLKRRSATPHQQAASRHRSRRRGSEAATAPARRGQPPSPPIAPQARDEARAADNQHQPGQMSREEARELLDSAKGDERHALGAPLRAATLTEPPEKPFKNW